MVYVRIVSGVYGMHVNGLLRVKDRHSEPFLLDEKEAARLEGLGVAEILNGFGKKEETAPETGISANDNSPPLYDESMSAAELRNIAKLNGLNLKAGMSKSSMIKMLDEHFGIDEAIVLTAEDVVE